MVKYNPNARSRGNATVGGRTGSRNYQNADGPGGSTVDYGPHKPRANYNFGSPRWDDRDQSRDYTPEMLAAEAAARQPMIDRRNELLGGNEAFMAAKNAGDLKGQIAAMQALRGQMQQDRFVAQGGTPETWQNRFDPNNQWPVPKSPLGVSSHGPGRPDFPAGGGVRRGASPTAGTAAATAGASGGMPPMMNPMMQGYLGGGAGQVSGGQGGQFGPAGGMPRGIVDTAYRPGRDGPAINDGWWNGYNPGQSKSGMGQNPMGGPMMSTGGDTGMYGGMGGGGLPPQLLQMLMMGGMGGMGGGSLGGMSPFGYNPAASMMNPFSRFGY